MEEIKEKTLEEKQKEALAQIQKILEDNNLTLVVNQLIAVVPKQ